MYVGPVEITGLDEREAIRRVEERLAPLLAAPVVLVAGGERLEAPSLASLGIVPDAAASVKQALSTPAAGPEVVAGVVVWRVAGGELNDRLGELAARVFRPPVNAKPGDGGVMPHREGRMLDMEGAKAALLASLASWSDESRGDGRGEIEIALPVVPVEPAIDVGELEAIRGASGDVGAVLLTGYTTYYDESMEGRAANVRLAAGLIDGVVVMPGETFSFNETVGPRLVERGFKPAPEIVGEEFVEGIGGGICQVSSTLYNAVLYADLKVVERYRHSVPLRYVPPGRDATLQYGVMDFKFRNTLDDPVVIRAEAGGGRLRVSLWGSRPLPYDVTITSTQSPVPYREVIEPDPKLVQGEVRVVDPGEPGKWIIVSKVVSDKATGEASEPVVVSRNYYPPKPRIVRVSAGLLPGTEEQATPPTGAPPVPSSIPEVAHLGPAPDPPDRPGGPEGEP